MAGVKEYEAVVDLSRVSPTDDLEAEAVPVVVDQVPARERVERLIAERFTGVIEQTPPAHSAVKIGGRRAYDLARAGHDTPVTPKAVRIDAIHIRRYAWPELDIAVTCGRGTYIRSLARDLGRALGTGGVLTGLRRTRVGPFTLAAARTLEDIPDPLGPGELWVPEEFAQDAVRSGDGSSAG
jgi:tRNA pseudouridine55 synthase